MAFSLRGKSAWVPLQTPRLSELWIAPTIQVNSRHGRAARMRNATEYRVCYPDLERVARAVIERAIFDANPMKRPMRGTHTPPPALLGKRSAESLRNEYDALLFLSNANDPDLLFWSEMAGYSLHNLVHTFLPLRVKFERRHGDLFGPRKQAPVNSTIPNSASHSRACA